MNAFFGRGAAIRLFSAHAGILAVAIAWSATGGVASAAILYESGTLGPTGIAQGSVTAANVSQSVYVGARFELSIPVVTSQIGGHFVSGNGGTFFGAIVALSDANDFPNSGNLSTPDVLGKTNLSFPSLSAEVYGTLELPLAPGWYALVFGSGLFGTTGSGGSLRNGVDNGNSTYIGFQPNSGVDWIDVTPLVNRQRFVISGSVVPEPSILADLWAAGIFSIMFSVRIAKMF